jgi:hypothetical protein
MSNPTSNFGWQMPTATDLVTDLPADFEVFGQAVDTSLADLKGGTTGQVLAKNSNANMDFVWVAADDTNAIQNAIVDAKGDLIAATAADTPARLAVGTNGYFLSADSTEATGLKWVPAPSGGKVLQVVSATSSTATSTTSTTFVDTALTANITPTSATSKVLILLTIPETFKNGGSSLTTIQMNISRNGTQVNRFSSFGNYTGVSSDLFITTSASYLDSPATTSSTTYRLRVCSTVSGQPVGVINDVNSQASIILMEIGA